MIGSQTSSTRGSAAARCGDFGPDAGGIAGRDRDARACGHADAVSARSVPQPPDPQPPLDAAARAAAGRVVAAAFAAAAAVHLPLAFGSS